MSDYISKSALKDKLQALATSNEMMGYLTAFDVVQDCIGIVENQPTISETEILRKPFERVVERLEKEVDDGAGLMPKKRAIEIVKEECGVNE